MMLQMAEFRGKAVRLVRVSGRLAIPAQDLAAVLGYKEGTRGVQKIFRRQRDEFVEGEDYFVSKLDTNVGRPALVFTHTGVNLICMFSQQPLAKEFRQWAKRVLAAQQVALAREEYERLRRDAARWRLLQHARHGKLSEEKVRALVRYVRAGLYNWEIGKLLDVHARTVVEWKRLLRDAGLLGAEPRAEKESLPAEV